MCQSPNPLGFRLLAVDPLRRPGAGAQPDIDERIQIPIHDPLCIGGLMSGPVVFHLIVGMEDIRADLAAEGDLALLVLQMVELLALLLPVVMEQPGAQNPHRMIPIAELGPFRLGLDHDTGRNVRDPYRRIGLVDVLAACTAGAEGIDSEILIADLDVGELIDLRKDENRCKRGVASLRLVERR